MHLPRPSPGEVGSRVPFGPLKGTSKGTWLLTSSPASMSAALSRTSFTLTVQLQKPGGQQTLQSAQASNSGETFSVDLMEGTVCAKLIRHPQNNMGVLLLAPCAKGPSGTTIGSQVGLALIKNPAIKATLLKQPVSSTAASFLAPCLSTTHTLGQLAKHKQKSYLGCILPLAYRLLKSNTKLSLLASIYTLCKQSRGRLH